MIDRALALASRPTTAKTQCIKRASLLDHVPVLVNTGIVTSVAGHYAQN